MTVRNMDMTMFLEFPGILITIGVALLLISIIIIIFAYRSETKVVDASKLSVTKPKLKSEKDETIEEVIKEQEEPKEEKDDINKLIEEIEKPKEIKEEKPIITEIEPIKEEDIKTIDAFESEFGSYIDDKENIKIEEPEIKTEDKKKEDFVKQEEKDIKIAPLEEIKPEKELEKIYETIIIDDKKEDIEKNDIPEEKENIGIADKIFGAKPIEDKEEIEEPKKEQVSEEDEIELL